VGNYLGLVIVTVALLVGFLLAFGSLTIIWRRHWETLGATESLLARLGAALLIGMFTLIGGQSLTYAVLTALQGNQGGFGTTADPAVGRNQALAVVAVALVLTIIGVLRIELYHRRATGISHRDETDDEWRTEEPEPTRAPRGGRS
jgi:hypothetical protein